MSPPGIMDGICGVQWGPYGSEGVQAVPVAQMGPHSGDGSPWHGCPHGAVGSPWHRWVPIVEMGPHGMDVPMAQGGPYGGDGSPWHRHPHGTGGSPWHGYPHDGDEGSPWRDDPIAQQVPHSTSWWHRWVPAPLWCPTLTLVPVTQRQVPAPRGQAVQAGRGAPHRGAVCTHRGDAPTVPHTGGTTAPLGARAPRRCWRCAVRAASWCGTARPAPTTTHCRSGTPWGGPMGPGSRDVQRDARIPIGRTPPHAFPTPPPRSSHGFVHVKLTRTRERHFVLGRAGAAFPSVPDAVRHYTARALPVRGARHLSLLYPVAAQPP